MARTPESASGKLVDDPNPTLAADIKMNGHDIASDGNKLIDFTGLPSAVNYLTIKNGIATTPAILGTEGADVDVDLLLSPKGAGQIKVDNHYLNFQDNPAMDLAEIYDSGTEDVIFSIDRSATPQTFINIRANDVDVPPRIQSGRLSGSPTNLEFRAPGAAVSIVQNSGDGSPAKITTEAIGTDTEVPLVLTSKGASKVTLGDNPALSTLDANLLLNEVQFQAEGSNPGGVDLTLSSKGGGAVNIYGPGPNSGVYIQAGGYVDLEATNDNIGLYGNTVDMSNLNTSIKLGDTVPFVDTNDNELLGTSKVASAVNYLQIKNAATTNGPSIEAVGTDVNVDLNLTPKGAGSVVLPGNVKVDSNDINMPDEKGIKFGSQNDNRLYWSEATHFGSFVWDSAAQAVLAMTNGLEIYGNTQLDGNGNWSPLIQWGINGSLTLQVDSTASVPELRLTADSGAIVTGDALVQDNAAGVGDGTTTFNFKANNIYKFTFGAQNEVFTFTAPAINTTKKTGSFRLILIQDGVGGRTVTWPANVKWAGGSAPTLSAAPGAIDIINFLYEGTDDVFYGSAELNFQ